MLRTLSIFLALLLFLCACSNVNSDIPTVITENNSNIQTSIQKTNYIDDITFLGESTTYHLKSRGVLSGGQETTQVWSPKSGTLMLDQTICECRIVYPESREELSLEDALKRKQPKIMLLTFGLNGAASFISRGSTYFKGCYQKLINLIKEFSPNSEIIINACYPIAKNMDMSRYTINAKTLNEYISTINLWAKELALKNNIIFTDTTKELKDSDGYLSSHLQANDGYHLNAEAYEKILSYLNKEIKKYKENNE